MHLAAFRAGVGRSERALEDQVGASPRRFARTCGLPTAASERLHDRALGVPVLEGSWGSSARSESV
jgi:hypothetical protein